MQNTYRKRSYFVTEIIWTKQRNFPKGAIQNELLMADSCNSANKGSIYFGKERQSKEFFILQQPSTSPNYLQNSSSLKSLTTNGDLK